MFTFHAGQSERARRMHTILDMRRVWVRRRIASDDSILKTGLKREGADELKLEILIYPKRIIRISAGRHTPALHEFESVSQNSQLNSPDRAAARRLGCICNLGYCSMQLAGTWGRCKKPKTRLFFMVARRTHGTLAA